MTRSIRAAAMVASAGLLIGMTACSSTGEAVSGTPTASEPGQVTVTQTATVTETAEVTVTAPTGSVPMPTGNSAESSDSGIPEEPLAPEPTNPPQPSDACATADLDVTLEMDGGAAGSVIYRLVFTNSSTSTCTMHGFPGVSYVKGDKGIQVGAPAAWVGDAGGAVTLKPGAKASALLQEVDVYNFDQADCNPVAVRGLRVYPPGQTKAAFVPQDGAVGCDTADLPGGQNQMSVQAVIAE